MLLANSEMQCHAALHPRCTAVYTDCPAVHVVLLLVGTFDASGSCTNIPQMADPKAHATACSSSRSCVKSYPVSVQQGLLWVYADNTGSSNGHQAAQQQQQQSEGPGADLLMPEGYQLMSPWFQRDVPLSYDILLENFLDPAHVPHSHHGVVVRKQSRGCWAVGPGCGGGGGGRKYGVCTSVRACVVARAFFC